MQLWQTKKLLYINANNIKTKKNKIVMKTRM